MAHYMQHQFVEWTREFFPEYFESQRVLEVGSLDFKDCNYVGLDLGQGPGVDVVCGGQDYDAADASFDVVCSFEAMEHNPFWKQTFANMLRLVRPGGLVMMTCATLGRPEHGTSRNLPEDSPLSLSIGWDYYRNLTAADFGREFDLDTLFSSKMMTHYYYNSDLMFFGFRAGAAAPAHAEAVVRKLRIRYLLRNLLHYVALKRLLNVAIGRAK